LFLDSLYRKYWRIQTTLRELPEGYSFARSLPVAVMKILVAYDGSPHADAAIQDLRHAGLPGDSEILVVSIANDAWPKSHSNRNEGQFDNPWNTTMKETAEIAERAANQVRQISSEWKVQSEPLWGDDPAEILLKTIDHWKPDLLVVGSHGRNAAGRLLLGSVSLELVHYAPCSVRVTRLPREADIIPNRIIVATDGSAHGETAVQTVAARCWPQGTEIVVLSIFDSLVPSFARTVPTLESVTVSTEPVFEVISEADKQTKIRLHDAVQDSVKRLKSAGLNVTGQVIEGNPLTQIAEEARLRHVGTIFAGARGLGTLDRLTLGSVSSAIVTHAHCTVEVVRASA
jgi:nucleotide-binding universal stress UspA family protein